MRARTPVITAVLAGAAGLLTCGAGGISAAEFCVTCEGPEAHYACTFDGTSAGPGDTGLKLYCITELAKSGKHASCSVDRTAAKPCAGDVKVLAMPDGLAPPPQTANSPGSKAPVADTAAPLPPPAAKAGTEAAKALPETPPKTVQEMVEKGTAGASKTLEKGGDTVVETAKSTGGAIDKAGKAVGETVVETAKSTGGVLDKAGKAVSDGAKKTWTCITSFFGDC